MCWQLDPTEGPGRVRRRMMRAPRAVSNKHFLKYTTSEHETDELGEWVRRRERQNFFFFKFSVNILRN